jgi:adenine C2-methylase RlmN of 23S rRNA A2503 and tRNA A37
METAAVLPLIERSDMFRSRYFDRQVSRKFLVRMSDGDAVETALYEHYLAGELQDCAIDISTMVGCPMACRFCAATSSKFGRALSTDEICRQVETLMAIVPAASPKIVCSFQGIGEPSLVARRVIAASRRLMSLDPRVAISVSTMAASRRGVESLMRSEVPLDNLQLSLCSIDDESLRSIMPRSPGAEAVMRLALAAVQAPMVAKVKVNYLWLSDRDTGTITGFFRRYLTGSPVIIKVSSLNMTAAARRQGLVGMSMASCESLAQELRSVGVDSFAFGSVEDIGLSCGQLVFE